MWDGLGMGMVGGWFGDGLGHGLGMVRSGLGGAGGGDRDQVPTNKKTDPWEEEGGGGATPHVLSRQSLYRDSLQRPSLERLSLYIDTISIDSLCRDSLALAPSQRLSQGSLFYRDDLKRLSLQRLYPSLSLTECFVHALFVIDSL